MISGNDGYGVSLESSGTTANAVLNNWIGTDLTGTTGRPNNRGVALTNAPVQEVSVEHGRAVGVRMADGRQLRAPLVGLLAERRRPAAPAKEQAGQVSALGSHRPSTSASGRRAPISVNIHGKIISPVK